MKFVVKDCDPTTGLPDSDEGYDDEYILEDLEINVADQIQKTKMNNFTVAWDAADTEGEQKIFLRSLITETTILITFYPFTEWVEAEDTYALSAVNTLPDAVQTIIKFLGLGPANATEKVPEGTHTHTILCSGEFSKFRNCSLHNLWTRPNEISN